MYRYYRHFKGNWYVVRSIGRDTDTIKSKVAYQTLYSNTEKNIKEGDEFYRDYDEFIVETDKEKYPNAEQKYRFMNVEELKKQLGEERVKEMVNNELFGGR
ncbi:Protein of unknown function (DUF1653) [Clostridium pasteurianum BC1]|uniref:DUF1653 domain-containing protein n=2 Tax=Clostridium pasteurianum TaxID=1501 RepID=R4KAD6_CLOPA|nr:Protein of unknown function (DUF1653) [Clostridium pasteurianum BC1]